MAIQKEQILETIDYRAFYEGELPDFPKVKPNGWTLNFSCPFHDEKTGSFSININTGAFNCLGCGQKGDVFAFAMALHGVDFVGAVNLIGGMLGLSGSMGTIDYDAINKRNAAKRRAEVFKRWETLETNRLRAILFDAYDLVYDFAPYVYSIISETKYLLNGVMGSDDDELKFSHFKHCTGRYDYGFDPFEGDIMDHPDYKQWVIDYPGTAIGQSVYDAAVKETVIICGIEAREA